MIGKDLRKDLTWQATRKTGERHGLQEYRGVVWADEAANNPEAATNPRMTPVGIQRS